jgi:ubiquitin carboxyl-terminal hydrolase 47
LDEKSTIDSSKLSSEKEPTKSKEETLKFVHEENLKLMEKYKADGPFVYELFACLVHQGGAMGGHYYAYILDKHSQTWFNFNDYRVNPSDIIELVEMFGGQSGRMASSSTNAYMLMYRLCG